MLEGFGIKISIFMQNGLSKCYCMPILWLDSQTLRKNLFLKVKFSPMCYYVINEITVSREYNVWFQIFCIKIELKLNSPLRNSKKSILNSDPTGPFRCVGSHYGQHSLEYIIVYAVFLKLKSFILFIWILVICIMYT